MIRSLIFSAAVLSASSTLVLADGHKTPFPADAKLYFVNIADGDTVSSPVTVQFGLSGMGVAPAGVTEKENVGHHHLLINRPPFGEDDAEEWEFGIANDDNHRHFGGGQTEVALELPAGTHTLQLVLGDLNHIPHDPIVMSEQITITVE